MKDQIIHALAANDQVRIVAVSGANMIEKARQIHHLSRVCTAALGRQMLMTAMMGSQLKNATDRVSTIIKGDGPAGNMVCTADPDCCVKAYMANPETELAPTEEGKLDVGGLVGHTGKLTVIRDLSMKEPYVGMCNLVSGEIAMDFAEYYTVSEQQPSLVYLGVRVNIEDGTVRAAGGMLVQPLPGCPDETIDRMTALCQAIGRLSSRLDENETLEDILMDVFKEEQLHRTAAFATAYRCDCSRSRIEKALISIGKKDLTEMIEQDGKAEVTCQFCNEVYRFNRAELLNLLQEAESGI